MKCFVHSRSLLLVAIAGLALASQASAAFVTPSFRGEANTTYQQWNVFTTASDAIPDVGLSNANGTPTVSSAVGTAQPSGNIYAFGAIDTITVDVPLSGLAGYITNVIVQTRTQGAEIQYGTINIGGVTPASSAELSRLPLGGFGGDLVDYTFSFSLAGNNSFVLSFSGDAHMSFDALVIDTQAVAVPEVGSLALASVVVAGFGGFTVIRKRRKAAC